MLHEGLATRLATAEDAEAVLHITHQAFEEYIRLTGIKDILALHETIDEIKNDIKTKLVFVCEHNNEIIGSVRIEINGYEGYLSRFGVKSYVQNLGVGKLLMNAVDAEMERLKIKRLCLHTGSKVTSLIRFYYGRGFYIDSTDKSRGYIRAYLCKDYE